VTPPSGRTLARFSREEFVKHRFSYRPGDHITFCGPNGRGKTKLTFELLSRCVSPKLPAIFFGMKPRDPEVDEGAQRLGFEKISTWPPPLAKRLKEPPGYLLRPPTVFDPDVDNVTHYRVLRSAMLDSYKRGNRIVVADEHYATIDLGLAPESIALWSRGRAMGCGLWGGVQKPSHIPGWGFNNAEHVILYSEPDVRNVKRFAEFGGIDPRLLVETVTTLEYYECVYLRRRGGVACIVNSE